MRPAVKAPAVAALACAAAFVVLLLLAYAVAPFPHFDVLALNGFESLRGPVATPTLEFISHTADPLPLGGFLLGLAAIGLMTGRRRQLAVAAFAVAGANVTAQILKVALAHPRARPEFANLLGDAAFPSGHATAAMSMALAAVMVAKHRWRPLVGIAGCAYAMSVVVAILVLGWHYPSDVLGGLLVAAGFAFGAVAASRALAGRDTEATSIEALAGYLPSRRILTVIAGAGMGVGLARATDLAAFASGHTSALAFLAFAAAACVALTLWAGALADR